MKPIHVCGISLLIITSSCLLQAMEKITPGSFNERGKAVLQLSVQRMHSASEKYSINTGLADIFNAIPASSSGIEDLINDPSALQNANECYNALLTETTYPLLLATFGELKKAPYPGAQELTGDIVRTMVLVMSYKNLYETSDIRVPEENMGKIFMGTSDKVNGKILALNADIDVQANKDKVRGNTLMFGYCMQ